MLYRHNFLFFGALFFVDRVAASPTINLLTHVHDNRTWYGSSAVSLQGPSDPILMTTSWVYSPEELIAYRPSNSSTDPLWVLDTTKVLKYQTLYIASTGAVDKSAAVIDSLAFWNEKPGGIIGNCSIVGFNSAVKPDLTGRSKGTWRADLSSSCSNINGAVPFPRFSLSSDGSVAIAWVQDDAANVHVFAFNGQTGKLLWEYSVTAPPEPKKDYFLAYGADLSADGKYVILDYGVVGGAGREGHCFYVVTVATGKLRAPCVIDAGDMMPNLSDDGSYLVVSTDGNNPSTGDFEVYHFNGTEYVSVGKGTPPLPSGSHGWSFVQYAFSTDKDSGATYVACAWYDTTLLGVTMIAMYDVTNVAKGHLSWAKTEPLPGNDFAMAEVVVDCAGKLCVGGFWTQKVNGPQPTVAIISADVPYSIFNFTSPGSTDAVSIVQSTSGNYYVAAVGCSSIGVCTKPGADAYLWEVLNA
jgi:hypothetical protein